MIVINTMPIDNDNNNNNNNTLQVRRSSLTMSFAKDQVLRGPLVCLGLLELSLFSPHVHRRQAFSTLVLIAPPVLWYQSHK